MVQFAEWGGVQIVQYSAFLPGPRSDSVPGQFEDIRSLSVVQEVLEGVGGTEGLSIA